MKPYTIYRMIKRLYHKALKNPMVRKPMAYAIYHVWKAVDAVEPERKTPERARVYVFENSHESMEGLMSSDDIKYYEKKHGKLVYVQSGSIRTYVDNARR